MPEGSGDDPRQLEGGRGPSDGSSCRGNSRGWCGEGGGRPDVRDSDLGHRVL